MGKNDKALERTTKPWSYEESVEVAKHCYGLLQKNHLLLVRELHSAQQALSNPGYRSDLTSSQNGTRFRTFDDYLEDVGIKKTTAYRWLALYDAKADKLLTVDEFKARKTMEFEELIKQLEASVGKSSDWRPEGWSTACENYYLGKMKQRKLLEIAQRSSFEQADLFNREYLASLSDRFDVASPEEILEFGKLCDDLKPYAVKEVPVPKQARVVKLVEAALAEFQPSIRDKVARFVAETIIRREVQ